MEKKIFAIDFDGTITKSNSYPEIGEPNWPVIEKVRKLLEAGHEVNLWTCRQGWTLEQAKLFCENELDLHFSHYNTSDFAISRVYQPIKLLADYYIDDCAMSINEFLETNEFDCKTNMRVK